MTAPQEHPHLQETLSDGVARRIRDMRHRLDWSAAYLAEQCAEAGYPQLTAEVIGNIERGRRDTSGRRRRDVTVDEAWALSVAFGVPMVVLLGPWLGGLDAAEYARTAAAELEEGAAHLKRAQSLLGAIPHIAPEQKGT